MVTARELSYMEIKHIRENTDLEIETFVHGALCYCYSGQCLMSSMIGGRSGNRAVVPSPVGCLINFSLKEERFHQIKSPIYLVQRILTLWLIYQI